MFKLSDQEYLQFCDLIRDRSGLHFEENKRYFVEKRIGKCFKETSFVSVRDYFRSLKYGNNQEELQHLVETLTTNETYFYRHIPQLESFAEEALPCILDEKRKKGDFQLNIWSAACSTGAEIYTIAILLREHVKDFSKWRINLLATDIDGKVLNTAETAIYDKRAIKDVPPTILRKYFKQLPDGRYELNKDISSSVTFQYLNLIDRSAMRMHKGKDVIFCRNVLIYFNDEGKRQVVHGLYNALERDGFIFLGHSESVGRISSAFRLRKFKKSLSYQK